MTPPAPRVTWLERRCGDVPNDDLWLTDEERDTLAGLHVPKRRSDWRLGRFTAKEAVRARLGPGAPAHREIGIRPAADGAPELLIAGAPAPLAISITHRAERSVVALAETGVALGCDLEVVEPRREAFLTDFFTAEEVAAITRAAPASDGRARAALVTRLWAAKEAALKALREGLRIDTRRIEVRPPVPASGALGWAPLTVVAHLDTPRRLCGWSTTVADRALVVVADPPCDVPIELR